MYGMSRATSMPQKELKILDFLCARAMAAPVVCAETLLCVAKPSRGGPLADALGSVNATVGEVGVPAFSDGPDRLEVRDRNLKARPLTEH